MGISRGKYLVIIVVIALLLTIALALFLHYLTFPSSKNVVNTTNKLITNVHRCKVLIADGLYDLFPNRTLINYLRSILVSKGCEVTIYLGSNVTIDVVACALSFGSCGYFSDLLGLLPYSLHLVRWFIGGYINRHHLSGLTGYAIITPYGLMTSTSKPQKRHINIILPKFPK